MATKNRPSVKKREREQMKRQRERQKAEKVAQRRERRRGEQDSFTPAAIGDLGSDVDYYDNVESVSPVSTGPQ